MTWGRLKRGCYKLFVERSRSGSPEEVLPLVPRSKTRDSTAKKYAFYAGFAGSGAAAAGLWKGLQPSRESTAEPAPSP